MTTQSICTAILFVLLCPSALAQWVQSSGLDGGQVNCFAVYGTNLFAGTFSGGIFRSTDNGTVWTTENVGLPMNAMVNAFTVSTTNLFAGVFGAGLFRSTDNGTNWTVTSLTNPEVLALATSGTNIYAGTYFDGVIRSTNNGANWTGVGLTNIIVQALAVSGTDLFAATKGGGVFRSTDNGTSWTAVKTGLTNLNVNALAVSGTHLFAGTSYFGVGGVYRSTDNGTNWTAVNGGLPLFPTIYAFAVSGTNIFAGINPGGVYLSTDDGTNWDAVNTDSMNTFVSALAVYGTHLFAGTSNGVWRRPIAEMVTSVSLSSSELPREFGLEQNFPNPFNPTTVVRYQLPVASLVRLSVFDLLGREVAVLVNERRNAGVYQVKFDGSNLASGVYFYRLHARSVLRTAEDRAGDFVQSKKIVLLK